VHVSQPIGLALLGNGLEEEVEFVVDGKSRLVVIEKISKHEPVLESVGVG
jgi:hypothetical protein